ncbi:hypothetical protein F7725_025974 [Dissostichus mawsoni]|uniref:Leucine-rich repeat-containing protein 49 n=1 Tax=Dissostichus mawsoni TaxID=36200 RepID=A0A7J5X6N7_DISMA|nr:hypothetical protein F7725_025974 [Dissostichus mawsoni]
MRAQKHNNRDKWMSLTPMVNSCKLHITAAKATERAQRMKIAFFQKTCPHSSSANICHDCTDSPLHNLVPLACGAQSGLDAVSHSSQDARGKSRRPTKSAGATFYRNALNLAKPAGGSGGYNAVPGNAFTQLPGDSFVSHFQRIDMDRRCLEECPQLGSMDELQLLNLQHNLITKVLHLSHLQQLVFLNLYDNHVSEMTGIESLSSLRILMLGKNRIHKICCLESLSKLNILDLHDNQICRIESVSHLSELRVLNLAGNSVCRVENLQGLQRLTELNLRHNRISAVTEVDLLPCLQCLFLSCNIITSVDQLACLGESRSLSELTLDGNPVALETWYKQAVLRCVLHLKQLDMKRITDEDRRMAGVQARKEEERKREGSGPERPPMGMENRLRTNSRPNSPRDPNHLAELDGDTLRLFGPGALEALERGWGVQTASAHMIFQETNICRLPQLAALAQVRRLDQLTIHEGGNPVASLALWRSFLIYRLHHFNLQRINGQEVTMNDVIAAERVFGTLGHIAATETPRCRLLLLLEEAPAAVPVEGRGRRAGLSPEELRDNGKLLGEGLSRALFNYPSRDCSAAESPEEGTVEASDRAAMIQQYLQDLVQRASETNLKGEALHKLWPSMFAEMVRDSVLEMRDQAAFRKTSLAKLSGTK